MKLEQTALSGVLVLEPRRFGDNRGFFSESWNKKTLADVGLEYDFVQDNQSLSHRAGTVRGLHFQAPPHAQAKLIRCGRGRIFDVAVDIRVGSPTYGQWTAAELSFDNGKQLLIGAGFLHAFMTLEPDTEVIYKCTDYYAPECDGSVRWDSCGIEWPRIGAEPTLSDKDLNAAPMSEFTSPFVYEE
jgi:dTDP-4-dehydrorhamnose 3,5-epimerase